MAGDPFWNETVALLHFGGTNGSTTFTDSKGLLTWTATSAIVSTDASVFGGSAGYFAGAGYISTPHSAPVDLVSSDFTMEFAVKPTVLPTSGNRISLVSKYDSSGTTRSYSVEMWNDGGVQKLSVLLSSAGTSGDYFIEPACTLSTSSFTRICINKTGSAVRLYVGEALLGSTTMAVPIFSAGSVPLRIGSRSNPANFFSGYIDEFRLTKTVGRNPSTYTIPSAAFPDAITKLSGVTKDISGALASKLVRAYRQDTGALVSQVISTAGTGAFSLDAGGNVPYYITEHDTTSLTMAGAETSNAAILDNLIPV